MAKNFKKGLSLALAAIMCAGTMSTTALAETTLENGNIWYGDEVKINVAEGKDSYTYMLFGDIPNFYYYETSNHTVKKEATGGGAVHMIALIDTVANHGEWTPSGVYESIINIDETKRSNYDVVYCCDAETGSEAGDYYKRLNLEDSEYFTDAQAKQIRAILTNTYPYLSVEDAKYMLKEKGFEQADELDRSELITATQAAVWSIANEGNGDSYDYNASVTTAWKNTWGGYLHDFSPEITSFSDKGTKKFTDKVIGNRIENLRDFLLDLDPVKAKNNQVVITDMEMAGTPVALGNGEYTVNIEITLNSSGSSSEDDINIIVTAGDEKIVVPVEKGTLKYDIEVVADVDDEIKAVVEGTQILPKGVYFYAPKADDVNGDGVATAREVSQNLVGVAMGETPIYSEKVLEFENVTFKGGSVSNISYMSINKETGEVEFIKKIDVDEGCTSAPIITADGYVSVMFMKQATSGMFWFSEEVDEDVQQAAIDCLIDNNPSYKGHNAIAFGKGEHDLEFKKGKVVTYTFNAGEVVIGKDTTAEEPVEEPSVEEPTVEEPFVEEPTVETPTVEEPVVSAPDVAVEGADITSKTVVNGVTAVYIKGEGKVPDVIWTSSKEVDADIIADLIKEFGADEDAKILSDFGTHKIEYQHNKNKTKTVKYTFEEV